MKNSGIEAQVLAADELRYQAMYRRDMPALERMLLDDYVHIHPNGKVDDKAAFLSSIEKAQYSFVDAVRTEQSVRLAGSIVLLHGKTTTTLDVAGQVKVMKNAFITIWTQTEEALQLLHWQATKLLEP